LPAPGGEELKRTGAQNNQGKKRTATERGGRREGNALWVIAPEAIQRKVGTRGRLAKVQKKKVEGAGTALLGTFEETRLKRENAAGKEGLGRLDAENANQSAQQLRGVRLTERRMGMRGKDKKFSLAGVVRKGELSFPCIASRLRRPFSKGSAPSKDSVLVKEKQARLFTRFFALGRKRKGMVWAIKVFSDLFRVSARGKSDHERRKRESAGLQIHGVSRGCLIRPRERQIGIQRGDSKLEEGYALISLLPGDGSGWGGV